MIDNLPPELPQVLYQMVLAKARAARRRAVRRLQALRRQFPSDLPSECINQLERWRSDQPHAFPQPPGRPAAGAGWHSDFLSAAEEAAGAAGRVEAAMEALGYPARDCFGVR